MTAKMKATLFFLLFSTFLSSSFAQTNWELRKDEDGIKVFTRKVNGSSIREFRAEAVMEGKLSNFVAVMQDVENYDELFTNQEESKILDISDTVHIHYVITDTPWPITDRDGVYKYTYQQDYFDKSVKIKIEAIEGYVEKNSKFVRMKNASGYWLFVPVDDNKVMVIFQMHAETEGNIPGWIINMFIVDSPHKQFQNLRERVKLKQYDNRKFNFLVE